MYVLATLECVENQCGEISIAQIAMIRVNESWKRIETFSRRIQPKDASYYQWDHIGYSGSHIFEYLAGPSFSTVSEDLSKWLQPDDIICWWTDTDEQRMLEFFPSITNPQMAISEHVARYIGHKPCSIYKLARCLGHNFPGVEHDAQRDVDLTRHILSQISFPQPIPTNPADVHPTSRIVLQGQPYYIHLDTSTIHKNGCLQIPENGQVHGFANMSKVVGKDYSPCDCVKDVFIAALRERNKDIIDRCTYNYLYDPATGVFHRRECEVMLQATKVLGTMKYEKCLASNLRPCPICRPSLIDGGIITRRHATKAVIQRGPTLSEYEQRAVSRHRQAQEQRQSFENNPTLSKEKRDDLYVLTQPGFAFFAANGYKNFHLRHCKNLPHVSDVRGFASYKDAMRAGYNPCKSCKPNPKHDVVVSLPIYTSERESELTYTVKMLCDKYGYQHRTEGKYEFITTQAGVWRIDVTNSPYRVDHINLTVNPKNKDKFHRQPRLFLSLRDVLYYIKRHDDPLSATKKT